MSDFSLTLVKSRQAKIINDMAKVSIKSEKITPFGGIFHVREHFSRFVGPVIDKVLGFGAHRSAIKARDCGFFVGMTHA